MTVNKADLGEEITDVKNPDSPGKTKKKKVENRIAKLGGQSSYPKDPAYNNVPIKQDANTAAIDAARSTAKKADVPPGIANAPASAQTIKDALDSSDPQRQSQVFKNLYTDFNLIRNVLSSIGASSISNSLQGGENPSLASSVKTTLQQGLGYALGKMATNFGYNIIVEAFNSALFVNGQFQYVLSDFQDVLSNVLIEFYVEAVQYGEKNIPYLTPPPVTYGPLTPNNVVPSPAAGFIQQYYSQSSDPFPGYIQWTNFSSIQYTQRTSTQYPFSSSTEEILYTIQEGFVADLTPLIQNSGITAVDLNAHMSTYTAMLMSMQESQCTGASSTGGGGMQMTQLLATLLPAAEQMLSKAQSLHLPNSVLDQGKINQVFDAFAEVQAKNKYIQQMIMGVVGSGGPMSLLNNLNTILNQTGIGNATTTNIINSLMNIAPYVGQIPVQAAMAGGYNQGPLSNLSQLSGLPNVNNTLNSGLLSLADLLSTVKQSNTHYIVPVINIQDGLVDGFANT